MKVDKFIFSTDFIILDMEEDKEVAIDECLINSFYPHIFVSFMHDCSI